MYQLLSQFISLHSVSVDEVCILHLARVLVKHVYEAARFSQPLECKFTFVNTFLECLVSIVSGGEFYPLCANEATVKVRAPHRTSSGF